MKKISAFIVLFILVSATHAQDKRPIRPADESDEVVRISTSLIQVDVTVTDSKGNVVSGLKPTDFEVFENGERQDITSFSFFSGAKAAEPQAGSTKNKLDVPPPPTSTRTGRIRRTFALVVDDLFLSFESIAHTRRALKTFVDEQMQDGDLVAIIRTGGNIGALQQFTTDKRQLYAAIERVRWNADGRGRTTAFAPIEPTGQEILRATGDTTVTDEDIASERELIRGFEDFRESTFAAGTLGALKYIVGGMRELPGRKSVVMFSDGFSLMSADSQRFLDFLKQVVDEANRSSVVFYTINSRGLQYTGITAADKILNPSPQAIQAVASARTAELHEAQGGLDYLAEETGGLAIRNINDLAWGVRRVLDDQSYYLIGYEPNAETFDVNKRKYNRLEVRVNKPGLTARYRSGFFNVPSEKVRRSTVTSLQTPGQQLQAALASPFSSNNIALSLNPIFGNDLGGSYVRSLLHVSGRDLTFVDQPDGTKKVVFDVVASSFGDNGVPVDQLAKTYTVEVGAAGFEKIQREGFVYFFLFPVTKPGAYQYRVAIRDAASGRIGSANKFLEVPDLKKQRLTLSSIILQNLSPSQLERLASGQPVDPADPLSSPMSDTSLRRFKIGTALQYGTAIYNARPGAALAVRTRVFREGKIVLDGQPIPVDISQQADPQRINAGGAINLVKNMAPGDYVLQVVIIDAATNAKPRLATQFVQFEVVE